MFFKINKKSLTNKFKLILISLSSIICLVSTSLSFYTQQKQVLNDINQNSEIILKKDVDILQREIYKYIQTIELISADERVRSLDWNIQKPLLDASVKKHNFPSMAFVNANGDFKSTTGVVTNIKSTSEFQRFMAKETVVGDPVLSSTSNKLVLPIYCPVYDLNENIIGALCTDLDFDTIKSILDKIETTHGGFTILMNGKGDVLSSSKEIGTQKTNPKESFNLRDFHKNEEESKPMFKDITKGGEGSFEIKNSDHKFFVKYNQIPYMDWYLIVIYPIEVYISTLTSIVLTYLFIAVFFITASIILSSLISKYLTKRLNNVINLGNKIQDNDFTTLIDDSSSDEIGTISKSINHSVSVLNNLISELKKLSGTIKNNFDITNNKIQNVYENIKNISSSTHSNSSELEENLAIINNIKDISKQSQELSLEILQKATENSQKINDINNKALEISKESKSINNEIQKTYKNSKEKLDTSIQNISVVNDIKFMAEAISEIAEKTNLLALNASIEAAREGERGKGFAVVADEIKNLANQSSTMASQIQSQIKTVLDSVDELALSSLNILDLMQSSSEVTDSRLNNICFEYQKDGEEFMNIIKSWIEDINVMSTNSEFINDKIEDMANTINSINESTIEIVNNVNTLENNIFNVLISTKENKEATDELVKNIDIFKTK